MEGRGFECSFLQERRRKAKQVSWLVVEVWQVVAAITLLLRKLVEAASVAALRGTFRASW